MGESPFSSFFLAGKLKNADSPPRQVVFFVGRPHQKGDSQAGLVGRNLFAMLVMLIMAVSCNNTKTIMVAKGCELIHVPGIPLPFQKLCSGYHHVLLQDNAFMCRLGLHW